jgi:hypothetical protein
VRSDNSPATNYKLLVNRLINSVIGPLPTLNNKFALKIWQQNWVSLGLKVYNHLSKWQNRKEVITKRYSEPLFAKPISLF